MSSRMLCSVRDAMIGSGRPSMKTLVRCPGPRPSSMGIKPRIRSERQYLPYPRNTMRPRFTSIRLFLSHFLLELLELARRCCFARRPVHVGLEQLVLEIHAGTRVPGLLRGAPSFHRRAIPLRGLELCLHVVELALRERQLFTLIGELALQDAEPLAVFRREAAGDGDGLRVLNLAGQPAAALGVRESLPLDRDLALRAHDGLLDLGNGDLRVDDRLTHLACKRSQVRGRRRIEGGAEGVPQALERV